MKRRTLVSIGIFLGLCATLMGQSPQELYNQALVQERAAGNLEQAIQLFQRVARESTADRALAAQALMGAARAYEKLGQSDASRNLYAQIVRAYPEQREQFTAASQRLGETGLVQGTVTRQGAGELIADAKVSLSGGPIDPEIFGKLREFFKNRPNPVDIPAPENGLADEAFYQKLADTASSRGVSVANPVVRDAISRFQAELDSRFIAKADSSGRFSLRDIPPGRYSIRAEREGYFPVDSPASPSVTVTAGRTTLVDVPMLRGATISGKITDASGQPMVNTMVQAYSVTYNAGFPITQQAVAKRTDDKGEYRLFWLGSGEYLIGVVPDGDPAAPPPPTTATSPAANGGLPAPRTFYPGTGDIATSIPVFVRGETPVSGIDIPVHSIPTFHIKGEIHSHIPVAGTLENRLFAPQSIGANFAIRPRSTNTPDNYATPTMSTALKESGDQLIGTFDVIGVSPGSYRVSAWTSEPTPDGGAGLAFGHAEIEVTNQDVTGIVIDIYPTVRVNGTLTINGTAPGQTTTRVALQADGSLAKAGVYQGLAARAVIPNSQTGAFMIGAVPAGHFRVNMGATLPPDLYVADVRQGGISVFDSGFDVGRESPQPIQVVLNSSARTVEGTVKDITGRPAANVTAVLVPPRERRQNRALYYTAKTDVTGHFKIQGVAPGTYSLFSWENMPDGAYFNERFVSRNEDAARRVNVVQGPMTGADTTLIPRVGR